MKNTSKCSNHERDSDSKSVTKTELSVSELCLLTSCYLTFCICFLFMVLFISDLFSLFRLYGTLCQPCCFMNKYGRMM